VPPFLVREAVPDEFELVLELVDSLLSELGEEGEEAGTLDHPALLRAWRSGNAKQVALLGPGSSTSATGSRSQARS
jgi:hypothetical protein